MEENSQRKNVAKPPVLAATPPPLSAPVFVKSASATSPPPLSAALPAPAPPKLPSQQNVVEEPKVPACSLGPNQVAKPRTFVLGACFLLICALGIGFALFKQSTHQGALGSVTASGFFSRKDAAADYVILCDTLLAPIKLAGAVQPSEAELAVATRRRQEEFHRISLERGPLAEIAQSILNEAQKGKEILTNLPSGRAFFSGAGDVLTGFNSSSNAQVWSGLEQAVPELLRGMEAYGKLTESINFRHGIAIKLAKLAPDFSGPITRTGALHCSFSEKQTGFLLVETFQTITLSNSIGGDLHNCVVFVRLSDAEGKSYVNVYFLPTWDQAAQLTSRYTDTDAFTKPLPNATRVEVQVWAREVSFEPILLKKPSRGWP